MSSLAQLVHQAGQLLGNGSAAMLVDLAQRIPDADAWERAVRILRANISQCRSPRNYFRVVLEDSQREIDLLAVAVPQRTAVSVLAASPYARYYANADQVLAHQDGGE